MIHVVIESVGGHWHSHKVQLGVSPMKHEAAYDAH